MPDPKIIFEGPLVLPDFARASGTFNDGDQTIYNPATEQDWLNHPIKATKREVPVAYLPNATAWQDQGLEPAAYEKLLVYTDLVDQPPIKTPKVVILRTFTGEELLAGLVALAPQLKAAGITVIRDPFGDSSLQPSFNGCFPALPITDYEMMEPGFTNEPVAIAKIEPEEFVGGEILEIWDTGERSDFGFLRSNVQSTTNTQVLPGYDVVFPSTTDLITFHRTIQNIHSDASTGITTESIDTWTSSVTTVLQSNPSPPGFIIHAMGVASGSDQSYTAPRFPALHTLSSGTVSLYEWTDLMTHCADIFTRWIPRCARYKGVFLWAHGTPIADPIIFFSDTMFGKIDLQTYDGINPQRRTVLDNFRELVGVENIELEEYAWAEAPQFYLNQLAKIKAQIEAFFDITLS